MKKKKAIKKKPTGKKTKPPALKVVGGTATSEDILRVEREPDEYTGSAPTWLSTDAKKIWKRMAPIAKDRNVLTVADVDAFADLCECIAEVQECERQIREARIAVGANGQVIKHPLYSAVGQYRTAVMKYLTQFGFTPSSRAELPLPDSDKSAFDQWLENSKK